MGRQILERERELAVLAGAVCDAAAGTGRVVLVYGEAGIGNSSLVEALRAQVPARARMLVGYCDDLATKRTLGPLRDLVGSVGTELARALREGADQERVLSALQAELDWPDHPTVLAVEDVHWADEATLDALRFLVRRVTHLPAVLLLTYRDDELTRDHPAQDVLGLASATEWARRLPLERLSADAVRRLSVGSRVDADHLFAVTSGIRSSSARSWRPTPIRRFRRPWSTRCWPGSAGWTAPPGTRWSSWPWCRQRWTAGWSRPSSRTGSARWRPRRNAVS